MNHIYSQKINERIRKMASLINLACSLILSRSILIFVEAGEFDTAVLLWETKETNTSIGGKLKVTSDEFQKYIEQKYTSSEPDPILAVFVEDTLSVEDLSWKDMEGVGNFPNLNNLTKYLENVEFMPKVENALDAIKRLNKSGRPTYEVKGELKKEYVCGDVVILRLPHESIHRTNMLRKHDQRICDMFKVLSAGCERTIGVLLGLKTPPGGSGRGREGLAPGYLIFQDPGGVGLLVTRHYPNLTLRGESVLLGKDSAFQVDGWFHGSNITMEIVFESHRLTVYFDNLTVGYWYLRGIHVVLPGSDTPLALRPVLDVYAPLGNSFHIGYRLHFQDRQDTELTFGDLQVQPFFLNPGSKAFGEAVDAVPFFTAAILSGVLVVVILGAIFTCGLCMLMDVRPITRFDDPNGKGLAIQTTDKN